MRRERMKPNKALLRRWSARRARVNREVGIDVRNARIFMLNNDMEYKRVRRIFKGEEYRRYRLYIGSR